MITPTRTVFENILKGDGTRRLAEIGQSDLIVGIPTFKNAKTVAHVIRTAAQGLQGLGRLRPLIAVADGGSSDNTLNAANNVPLPAEVRRVSGLYYGMMGKGSGVRAIFEMARALRARIVILLEADLQSIEPQWIPQLAAPLLAREYEFVLPLYTRPLTDSAVTDLIAYPLTRAMYGVEVRQPMGGEFALSGELAAKLAARDVWETDVAKHGVDIWLTTVAINEEMRVCQVRLGVKNDNSREGSLSLDPTFVQAVGTLFRLLDIYRKRWREGMNVRALPIYGNGISPTPQGEKKKESAPPPSIPVPMTMEQLAEAFRAGARRYNRLWRSVLAPTNLQLVRTLAEQTDGPYRVTPEIWTRIVFDFAVVYNKGEGDPDKVAAALLPIYFARMATVLKASGGKADAIERLVQEQAQIFAQRKDYLKHRWETYVPWLFDGVR